MRIKKIICLALCLVMMGFALVGCEDLDIGHYLPGYDYVPPTPDKVEYNLYIIGEAETTENAKITVQRAINQYIDDKYDTKLNIFYCDAATYADTVAAATADGATDKAHIVLINSSELMETLMSENKLVNVLPYITEAQYKEDGFGTLNVSIDDDLLDAAKVEVDGVEKLFCIPNNHVIGEYSYVAINKQIARFYNISDDRLAETDTAAEADALWAEIEPDKALYTETLTKDMFVTTVTGDYASRNTLLADGWYVNVETYPTVDADEVYSTAFAIVAGTEKPERAMEMIYAINTDAKLRNLLQYGEENKNYTIRDGVVVPVSSGNSVYRMNILYTGDVFMAYYCELYGWNAEKMAHGILQNEDSVLP